MTKILIAHSDKLFAHMLVMSLQNDSNLVDHALSIEEILQKTGTNRGLFDLMLIDQEFNGNKDVIELIRNLKAQYPATDLVLLLASHPHGNEQQLLAAGASRYIYKPIETALLQSTLNQLANERRIRFELKLLEVVTTAIENTQAALSLHEVAATFAEGGQRLGFERSRLYKFEKDSTGQFLNIPVSQYGTDTPDFYSLRFLVSESKYGTQILENGEKVTIFCDQSLGETYLSAKLSLNGYQPPVGQWVGLRLDGAEGPIGMLILDNATQGHILPAELLRILHVYARQAGAALDRAMRFEDTQITPKALHLISRVQHRVEESGITDLETLLTAIGQEILVEIPHDNFISLVGDKPNGWFNNLVCFEEGVRKPSRWYRPSEGGLVTHIANLNAPLFLPSEVTSYRAKHGIPQIGPKPAQSFMGIPLKVGSTVFGALILEDDSLPNAFSEAHFKLFCKVGEQISGLLQAAWLREVETARRKRLELLQTASEEIVKLAKDNELWLWHAVLTIAVADYGYRFDRAMLFIVEDGGQRLSGKLGIGFFDYESADAYRQSLSNSFESYLHDLRDGSLLKTPLDQVVQNYIIESIEEYPILASVIKGEPVRRINANEIKSALPSELIEAIRPTNYTFEYPSDIAIVSLRSGDRTIGVVIVDNVFQREPPIYEFLQHFDTLTNHAALAYEDRAKSQNLQQLLHLNHKILSHAGNQPLKETLHDISLAAQSITNAHSVSIYPLIINGNTYKIDADNIAWLGTSEVHSPSDFIELSPYMEKILEDRSPLEVPDVAHPTKSGMIFAHDPYIQAEQIRSFIGVPICDHQLNSGQEIGAVLGLLYIDFHHPRQFKPNDTFIAESFANLASVSLRNWRNSEGLRNQKEAKEYELRLLGNVLRQALSTVATEDQIVTSVLKVTQQLFKTINANANIQYALQLKTWLTDLSRNVQPKEMRKQYYLGLNDVTTIEFDHLNRGLTGLAMNEGCIINVGNIHDENWMKIYYPFNSNTLSELDFPIKREDGAVIGVFNIESSEENTFTKAHEEILQRLGIVTILMLDNIRYREQMRSILAAVDAISEPSELKETLQAIVKSVREIVPSLEVLTIWHSDEGMRNLILGDHFGVNDTDKLKKERPRKDGAIEQVISGTKPIWADDVNEYEFFRKSRFIIREKIVSTAAIPLMDRHRTIGVLFFAYRNRHKFTTAEKEFLSILSEFVALGIKNSRLLEEIRKEKTRVSAALQMTNAMGSSLELQEIVQKAKSEFRKLYHDVVVMFFLYEKASGSFKLMSDATDPIIIDNPKYAGIQNITIDANSLIGHLAKLTLQNKQEEVEIIGDVANANHYLPLRLRTKSVIGITLINHEGELLAGLILEREIIDGFDEEDKAVITGLARQLAISIERAKQSAALSFGKIVTDVMIWATDLSHDLNRETYHIRSWLQVLQEERKISTSGRNAIDEIEKCFGRIVANAPWAMQELKVIELNSIMEQWMVDLLKPYAEQVSFRIESQFNNIKINTHSVILQKLLQYLIRNALKAMHYKGSLLVRIFYVKSNELEIQLEDSGYGISNESPLRNKIFREPTSVGSSGGLGLLFVRLLIERIGGYPYLKPYEFGKGACFCVRLPVELSQRNNSENEHTSQQ